MKVGCDVSMASNVKVCVMVSEVRAMSVGLD